MCIDAGASTIRVYSTDCVCGMEVGRRLCKYIIIESIENICTTALPILLLKRYMFAYYEKFISLRIVIMQGDPI